LPLLMDIKTLKKEYTKKKKEIKSRLKEFEQVEDHFYELCFCVLTPQSNAYRCDACIKVLKDSDFASKEMEIEEILKKYTRFHKSKSKYLIQIKDMKGRVLSDLKKYSNSEEMRDYLVKTVKGLGMKEASHYLRNTGHKKMAILDRHILKNLKKLKVIDEIPKSITKKKYLEIEDRFIGFAKGIGIPMDELDLLFWSMETGSVFK